MLQRANSHGSINKKKKNGFLLTKEKSQPEFRRTGSKEKIRRNNDVRPEFNRGGSRDNVRKIVEKEGKIARNLVAWSVPSEKDEKNKKQRGRSKQKSPNTNQSKSKSKLTKSPPQAHYPNKPDNLKLNTNKTPSVNDSSDPSKPDLPKYGSSDGSTGSTERETKSEEYQERIRKAIEKGSEETNPSQRPNSVTSFQTQKNLRARYWSYLFDNFHRAVDEIYTTCEHDESTIECKEVIMMLESCKRDFTSLIHRLDVFNQYENSNTRPQSLAWEVRKQMSPGKCSSPTMNPRRSPSPAATRFLNFGAPKMTPFSWADRVRGFSNKSSATDISIQTTLVSENNTITKGNLPSPVLEASIEESNKSIIVAGNEDANQDEEEGWELVTKGRSRSKGSNFSNSSGSSVQRRSKNNTVGNATENNLTKSVSTSSSMITDNNSKTENSVSTTSVEHARPGASLHREDNNSATASVGRLESLSRSSTIIEEYVDVGDVSDTLMQSTSSFNVDTVDLAFGLTESEIQIKEEQEKALASAIEEEENLCKELEEEVLKVDDHDDDISSDRDYTVSDGRETPKDISDEIPLDSSMDEGEKQITWEEMCQQYDQEHESGSSMDWGEMMELSETVRMPGRALELHNKLSSPSRKKSRSESVKRSEERMARAERRRLKFLVDKCERLRSLSEKVRNVRELKYKLISEKEESMVHQMKRAEMNRTVMLQEKVRKAQEEEMKVNEIAFINCLEAQNKRMEVQEKHQISEARLQELMEKKQRRKEDKIAKEEAAMERRKQIEHERLARLEEIKEKRGNQAAKWQKERTEREKVREEQAKGRQRDREMKVAARNEALQQATEELQKRIEQKHIESTKRHEQKLSEVKEKSRAASSSRHSTVEETPSAVPYSKLKKCTLCDVEIFSDVYMVSHLKGKQHKLAVKEINKKITDAEMESFSSKFISDADGINPKKQKEKDEREKTFKKRGKKLKARMANKGREYESALMANMKFVESSKRGKLQKNCKEISKILQGHSNGPWPQKKIASIDKVLGELTRAFEGPNTYLDKRIFCQIGGLSTLSRILLLWDISNVDKSPKKVVPAKLIKHTTDVILISCKGCLENCQYMLLSNKIALLVDLLGYLLNTIESKSKDIATTATTSEKDSPPSQLTISSILSSSGNHIVLALHPLLTESEESHLVMSLLDTIQCILAPFCPKWPIKKDDAAMPKDFNQRLFDFVNYVICENIFEKLSEVFATVHGPVEDNETVLRLQTIVTFIQPLAFCLIRLDQIFHSKKEEASLFCQLIQEKSFFGLVALLYSLLHQGATRISPSPLPLGEFTVSILVKVFRTMNTFALIDVPTFQRTLAGEGTSFQYRSVTNYLLRYTSINDKNDELLHEVIINIGYFTVVNEENQAYLQLGRGPSVLQQLTTLPFGFFSDPRLKNILFPTLISVCFKNNANKETIAQDVSPAILSQYIEERMKDQQNQAPKSVESIDERSNILLRFPKSMLIQAQEFFLKSNVNKMAEMATSESQQLSDLPVN
eukprot:TCONS_00056982-protein